MKSKYPAPIVVAFMLLYLPASFANKSCWCDIEEPGVSWDAVTYETTGNDCCRSTPVGDSGFVEHMIWDGSGWVLDSYEDITGAAAQSRCCPNS